MSRWHNIYVDGYAYFFTSAVVEFLQVLKPIEIKNMVLEKWNFYRDYYSVKIYGYVIMPEHFHIILWSQYSQNILKFMQNSLKNTSKEIINYLEKMLNSDEYMQLAENRLTVFKDHARGKANHKVWKERAKGIPITSGKVLLQKLDYLHKNPLRRKVVTDLEKYMYSSYQNYYRNDHSLFKVDFPVEFGVDFGRK